MNAARILIRRTLFSSRMGHLSGPVRSFSLHKLASPLKITKTRPLILHLVRNYSAASSLSTEDIQNRIIDILKSFEKVDQSKVTVASHFTDDLGLDSLDAVEVVMAIEEEFSIEIPDKDADEIKTVQQAIDYVSKCEEAS